MLSQAKSPEVVVLDSVAGTAGDISVSGGFVSVTGGRKWKRRDVADNAIQLQYFLNEKLESQYVTVSAAVAGTEYRFLLLQQAGGEVRKTLVSYTPSVTTLSTFSTGLTAAVQAKIDGGQFKGTATAYNDGTNYGVNIAGLTGYATFSIAQVYPTTITVASAIAVQTGTTTDPAISSGVLTITKSSHGYNVGDVIRFYGYTGTINGISSSTTGGFVGRIMTKTTNAFTMWVESSSGFSCAYADARVTQVASQNVGSGANLIAQLGQGDAGTYRFITSGNTYSVVRVDGLDSSNGNSSYVNNPVPFTKIYLLNASGDAADTILAMARFQEIKNWYVAGDTTTDPALMS